VEKETPAVPIKQKRMIGIGRATGGESLERKKKPKVRRGPNHQNLAAVRVWEAGGTAVRKVRVLSEADLRENAKEKDAHMGTFKNWPETMRNNRPKLKGGEGVVPDDRA